MLKTLILMLLLPAARAQEPAKPPQVKTGIDVLAETGFFDLQGKKVGLITNATGKNGAGMSDVEVLSHIPGVTLAAIFTPEHGFTGQSEEDKVSSGTLRVGDRNIPIISLYSGGIEGMRPRQEDLKNVDVLVFDIQDIGARFYTYVATMGMALEEAAKAGVPFMVLDRPNPVSGDIVEGSVLEDMSLRKVTATAYFPVATRHGMTAGEIALMHNAEIKHPKLSIVKVEGWTRGVWYDQTGLPWTPPSPNIPELEAAILYSGVAGFEPSNISVGRGTPAPFRWIGAPWLDADVVASRMNKAGLEGIRFSAEEYTPSKSNFAGTACRGVRMKVLDREKLRPLAVFAHLAAALRDRHKEQIQWRWDEALRMTGTRQFQKLYESGASGDDIAKMFDEGAKAFRASREPYLLY